MLSLFLTEIPRQAALYETGIRCILFTGLDTIKLKQSRELLFISCSSIVGLRGSLYSGISAIHVAIF